MRILSQGRVGFQWPKPAPWWVYFTRATLNLDHRGSSTSRCLNDLFSRKSSQGYSLLLLLVYSRNLLLGWCISNFVPRRYVCLLPCELCSLNRTVSRVSEIVCLKILWNKFVLVCLVILAGNFYNEYICVV